MRQFDFRNNQTAVLALKHVDLPRQAIPSEGVPELLDEPALAEIDQRKRILHWNVVFELEPPDSRRGGLDRQKTANPIDDPDARRGRAAARKIALLNQEG